MTASELYKSILFRAAEIYNIDFGDVERRLGQEFDPLVRFMSGALADELEGVYEQIDNTERRILQRLSQVLMPEHQQLPRPAHALARAQGSGPSFMIDESTAFVHKPDSNEPEVAFSPVFPSRITAAQVRVVATERKVCHRSRRRLRRTSGAESAVDSVRRLCIGFSAPEPLRNWHAVSLFFDLNVGSESEHERALLFNAMKRSQCAYHRQMMSVRNGLAQVTVGLADHLNGNERQLQRMSNAYNRQFLTFFDDHLPDVEPVLPQEHLTKWFKRYGADDEEIAGQIDLLHNPDDEPLYWIEVEFSKSVMIPEIETKLRVEFNVFPVLNRRLAGNGSGEHHYLQDHSIKWVNLEPKEDFLSIRRVVEERGEQRTFVYKPFAEFRGDRMPTYTLRFGGVGRWDDFNAWQRMSYLVKVLRDDFKYSELVEQAAGALSLEDVHHLLAQRMDEAPKNLKPTQNIYVLIHGGVERGLRVRIEYWTSLGEAANGIQPTTPLKCTTRESGQFEKDSLELVTSTKDGKDPLNDVEQLYAIKHALLSRGRIVTREDIRSYCMAELGERLQEVEIRTGVGVDERIGEGMTRILEIVLRPKETAAEEDWVGLSRQVQSDIEMMSFSSIPIKVIADV